MDAEWPRRELAGAAASLFSSRHPSRIRGRGALSLALRACPSPVPGEGRDLRSRVACESKRVGGVREAVWVGACATEPAAPRPPSHGSAQASPTSRARPLARYGRGFALSGAGRGRRGRGQAMDSAPWRKPLQKGVEKPRHHGVIPRPGPPKACRAWTQAGPMDLARDAARPGRGSVVNAGSRRRHCDAAAAAVRLPRRATARPRLDPSALRSPVRPHGTVSSGLRMTPFATNISTDDWRCRDDPHDEIIVECLDKHITINAY
jgi:hypothetical protein